MLLIRTRSSNGKPRLYAGLVPDMNLRGLVSFGPSAEGHRRSLCGSQRRQEKQRLLSTLAVSINSFGAMAADRCEHPRFTACRRPTGCVNTSFCQGCPLSCSCRMGSNVPEHLRHLPVLSPQLQVLAMGFSWALYFCQKDGGELQ